jgi:hypothetical protein
VFVRYLYVCARAAAAAAPRYLTSKLLLLLQDQTMQHRMLGGHMEREYDQGYGMEPVGLLGVRA